MPADSAAIGNGQHQLANDVVGHLEDKHEDTMNGFEEDSDSDGDDRRLLILYASQTGSAQDVAEYIGREAWRRHFVARVQDVKDFDKVRQFRRRTVVLAWVAC